MCFQYPFTTDVREAEPFVPDPGRDRGIASVNIRSRGAELGGENDTGGGRRSASDVRKSHLRRQTSTVNHSREPPLAQGMKFG